MKPVPGLLLDLGRKVVELDQHPSDPNRLRFRPASLPPELAARVRGHKPALLDLLTGGPRPFPDSEAAYILAERLGVAEGLGMPTHPGAADRGRGIAVDELRQIGLPTGNHHGSIVNMAELLNAIRKAIRDDGRTPAEIADAARIARSQLSRLLSGERGLSVEGMERVAGVLGLEIVIRAKRARKGK